MIRYTWVVLIFSLLFTSISVTAQQDYVENDNSKQKLHYTLSQEQGLTTNLAEKQKTENFKQVLTANLHLGLSGKFEYKNYFISLGYFWHGYTVGTSMQDPQLNTGHVHKSSSEFYAYKRIPFKVGYVFETRKSWLSLAPFIAENLLYSKHSGYSFTSTGNGTSMDAQDTIVTTNTVSMARPYRSVFAPGAGLIISAGRKWLTISLLAEYYQAFKTWTEIRDINTQDSQQLGFYSHTEYYHSKARTINLSLSLNFRF